MLTNSSHTKLVRRILTGIPDLQGAVSSIRELEPDDFSQKPAVQYGYFDRSLRSIVLKEPLPDGEFKALLLHETAHALLDMHLGKLVSTDVEGIMVDSLLPFFSESVFPHLESLLSASRSNLKTTYIDALYSDWTDSARDRDAETRLFIESWNEVFCDLYALYAISRLTGTVGDLLPEFEKLLKDLGFSVLKDTL